jgi:membrane protease YdiL (CAAX protease family)
MSEKPTTNNQISDSTSATMLVRRSLGVHTVLFVLLFLTSILVYTIAGYNYFMDATARLIAKTIVPTCLFIVAFVLYRRAPRIYFRIAYSFAAVSLGFLFAWLFGGWYELIPGLTVDSPAGFAAAKFAEVLPIVLTVIVLIIAAGDNLASLYLTGGRPVRGLLLGFAVVPVELVQFAGMGGFAISVGLGTLVGWIPWMLIFAFSNGFMEELIIRGLFLRKYEVLFGPKESLIFTSVVFAAFHAALAPFLGLVAVVAFVLITLVLGLLWGYIIQKSNSIWGAVVSHAIADMLFFIAVFGGL